MFKQLTVFLENRPGRMADATGCLAEANINLHALSIADTSDFGILRIIVSEPEKARDLLRERGFSVRTADVIAVSIGHTPGSLHKVLKSMEALGISIEYLYAFTSLIEGYDAIVIFRLENQDEALKKLEGSGIETLGQELLR